MLALSVVLEAVAVCVEQIIRIGLSDYFSSFEVAEHEGVIPQTKALDLGFAGPLRVKSGLAELADWRAIHFQSPCRTIRRKHLLRPHVA